MGVLKRGTRNVIRHPLRLILVVVLLGTSLALMAAMFALTINTQARIEDVNSQIGTDITISRWYRLYLTNQQLMVAEHTPGVASFNEQVYLGGSDAPGEPLLVPAGIGDGRYVWWGLSPGTQPKGRGNLPARIMSGRGFNASESDANVVLMSAIMAQANRLHVGSTFTYNGTRLTLIGLYTTGVPFGDLSVILPLHTAERVLRAGVAYLIVDAPGGDQVNRLASLLRQRLGNQVNISTHADQYGDTLLSLHAIRYNSLAALVASLVAAMLVIVFTVFLSLRERAQEIGVLKAIGASSWQIISQLSVEVFDMCILAAIAAVLLLLTVGPSITSLAPPVPLQSNSEMPTPIPAHLSGVLILQAIVMLLGGGTALAVLACALTVSYVVRLEPIQALQAE